MCYVLSLELFAMCFGRTVQNSKNIFREVERVVVGVNATSGCSKKGEACFALPTQTSQKKGKHTQKGKPAPKKKIF